MKTGALALKKSRTVGNEVHDRIHRVLKSRLCQLGRKPKKQVLKSLTKIEADGMIAGQPLHGILRDCRRLKHKKLGLRIVFRQSAHGIEIIEIVVIGKREDDEVYDTAVKRLGR